MKHSRRSFMKVSAATVAMAATGHSSANDAQNDAWEWWSASKAAERIRSGHCTSVELTEFMLERIKRIDATLCSYLTIMQDSALESARIADERMRVGKRLGPLHGVPVAVKDLCCTKGVKTTAGMAILQNHVPDYDATVVARLKSAGAVILGKLNLTEGALITYNPEFPFPLNPWRKDAYAGSSSSGSGVAAAAGLAYGTIGSDTLGSIRSPSARCGVVGLKPTWGKVSRYGVFPLAESLDHIGPMARRTKDCAILLDAIAGDDVKDPTSLPHHQPITPTLNGEVRDVRLGWDEEFASNGVSPDLFNSLRAAIDHFENLGVSVKRVRVPDLVPYGKASLTICGVESLVAHTAYYPKRKLEYGPGFREWLDRSSKITTADHVRAMYKRQALVGTLRKVFEGIDVLLCPANNGIAIPVTAQAHYGTYPASFYEGEWTRFMAVLNMNGAPTLTIPCGWDKTGLPHALQLVGKHGSEGLLCRLGHRFEEVTDAHSRHPSLG